MALKAAARDGVSLRYDEAGSGEPPLLFIHGWCCDHTYWARQVPAFSADHRVVAVDLRGHGESDKPDQDYAISGFVDDLAWLCYELGLERPVIVGHSMGGVIGMNLVRKRRELARALVMVDSPAIRLPEALQPVLAGTLAGLKSPSYVETAKSFVATFMFREDSDPSVKESVIQGMAAAPQRVMRTALGDTVAPENLVPGPIGVPTLFVRASTQLSSADGLRQRYPGLEVVEVDVAHFLHMEKPAEFNAILREFLEELR